MGEPAHDVLLGMNAMENTQVPYNDNLDLCSKVLIQIIIPDHHWKFVYKVPINTSVRELLRRVFCSCHLDAFQYVNYGLYIPPTGSQKGKFLQEERLLNEYPQLLTSPADDLEDLHFPPFISEDDEEQFNRLGNAASLKLIQKCRFVDGIPMNQTKFKQLNSKSNRKQLLTAIQSHNMLRIEQLLDRGLDPNFQCKLTGDTPLCCAAEQWHPRELILKLVEKGALLEFRDSDTLTPLHRAAIAGNFEAMKALLDLGQNPNVRDARDLTPLYHAVSQDVPTRCITQLLYDHAILGIMDDKNRQEIHQACLFDHPQHLEQLIIYGADLDAQTANLDTPLHICALNNHETCLRLLLKYGASRSILNASGQTPAEVAMLTGLNHLAEVIDTFTDDQIVPVTKAPMYNQDRKPSATGPRAAFESVRRREPVLTNNGSNGRVSLRREVHSLDRVIASKEKINHSSTAPAAVFAHSVRPNVSCVAELPNRSVPTYSTANKPISAISRKTGVRVVQLQRGNTGFGFRIRGQKGDPIDTSTTHWMASQYFDRIIPDSPAARAGLNPGDRILEVNGRDVSRASHFEVTDLIVESGSQVTLTILPHKHLDSQSSRIYHQCERNRLFIADHRHSFSHRTQSTNSNRNSQLNSRDSSLSNAENSDSLRKNRPNFSPNSMRKSIPTTASGNGTGLENSKKFRVTVLREIPARSVPSSCFENVASCSSKNSSLLSYNSAIDVAVADTTSSSLTEPGTASSSSVPHSTIPIASRIMFVSREPDDCANETPLHTGPQISSSMKGQTVRVYRQWPDVICSFSTLPWVQSDFGRDECRLLRKTPSYNSNVFYCVYTWSLFIIAHVIQVYRLFLAATILLMPEPISRSLSYAHIYVILLYSHPTIHVLHPTNVPFFSLRTVFQVEF